MGKEVQRESQPGWARLTWEALFLPSYSSSSSDSRRVRAGLQRSRGWKPITLSGSARGSLPKPDQRTLSQREKTRLPALLLLPLTPRTPHTHHRNRKTLLQPRAARPDQKSCSLYRKFSHKLRASADLP